MMYYQPTGLVLGEFSYTAFVQDGPQNLRPVTRMSGLERVIVIEVAAPYFLVLYSTINVVSESSDLQRLPGLGVEP